jgi:Zn-dependent protease/CBS domain-containing protein
VLLHELGHSVIAMRYKIKVRRITLFIFGGVAEISGEPPKASAEFWIAIAGPVVSFALAVIFYFLEQAATGFAPVWAVLKYLSFINFILAVFNLIPGFPLDGGRVFRAIVWGITHNFRKSTYIAATVGRFFGFFFIFIGVLRIFSGDLADGIWIAFIGWFLESAATSQLRQEELHEMLGGHKVSDIRYGNYQVVPSETTLQNLVDHHILGSGRRSFLVQHGDHFLGLLTLHRIREVPKEKWSTTPVTDIMIPKDQLRTVKPNLPLWDTLLEMDRDGVNQLPVVDNDKMIGIISREDIITYLRTLQDLG